MPTSILTTTIYGILVLFSGFTEEGITFFSKAWEVANKTLGIVVTNTMELTLP